MSIYNQTGVKISQYQTAQVDNSIRPNKLALEHFLISYAPSYYGTSTINKNFKVPVNLLRNDFIGYVGIKNAKSDWRNTIKLWCGDWSSSDLPNSYICTWTKEDIEKYPNDFITDKHADEKGCDKIFIINNAPLPETEEAGLDPNPNTKKIVTKDYVDSRFNGSPKVYCEDTTLRIRSYPCIYIFENESLLNIDITDTDENGNTLKDLIGDKCLDFIIRVPTFSLSYYKDPYRTDFTITHNGKGCRWGFKNELIMMLDRARQENVKDLWFKCYAEYINGEFTVNCTNGLNVLENEIITGAAGIVTEIDETYNGKEVPTEEAVVNYVHLHTDNDVIHVTQDDKKHWNSIQSSVENLTGYQFDEKYETTYFQLFDINSPLFSYNGIGFETVAHDTGYLESIEVACRLGGKNPTDVSTWAIIWRIVDDNSFEKLGCSDNSVIHNIDTTEEFNVKYNFHKSIISLSEGDRIRITYHSIDQKHTNSTSASDCSLGCMASGSTDKESYYKILNTNAIRENYCPRHKIAIQGNKSLKSLIELTRTELYNEVSSKSDFISTNLNNETERAERAEEALGGRIDQLSQNTTNSIDTVHERIDGVDNRIDGIDERIDNLDSNKSSNGITIEQTDGKITSLAVQSATVNDDGTLKDIDNVITGTEVKKLINNVTTEFSKVGVNYKIETSLPKPASSQYKGWIYLIPKSTSVENNEYIEFICVDKDENTWAWEQIGTTKTDLTEFVKNDTFNSTVSDIENNINLLNSYFTKKRFSTLDNTNYVENNAGKSGASGIQLSREHFTTGVVDSIDIQAIGGNSITTVNNIILCAIIYNEDEDESTTKTLADCVFSSNEVNQVLNANEKKSYTFTFDKLILPENYKFVRLLFAKKRDVIPVPSDTNTCHDNVRIQVLKRAGANSYEESPDDECKILTNSGSQNWFAAVHAKVYKTSDMYETITRIIENKCAAKIAELEKVIEDMKISIKILQDDYNISSANNLIPDASQWNSAIHNRYNLEVNSITYDNTKQLGVMLGDINVNLQ